MQFASSSDTFAQRPIRPPPPAENSAMQAAFLQLAQLFCSCVYLRPNLNYDLVILFVAAEKKSWH